jgi:hypothetical protein
VRAAAAAAAGAAAVFLLHAGNMVGPSVDWSKQVLPATAAPSAAAVPKPAAVLKPGVDVASLLDSFQFLGGSRGTSKSTANM